MSRLDVYDFLLDDENRAKFLSHGLSARQILQVLSRPFLLVRNRSERRALYLVIGTDDGGQCIAIPIEPTHEDTLWRPVTAWPCKDAEKLRLDRMQ